MYSATIVYETYHTETVKKTSRHDMLRHLYTLVDLDRVKTIKMVDQEGTVWVEYEKPENPATKFQRWFLISSSVDEMRETMGMDFLTAERSLKDSLLIAQESLKYAYEEVALSVRANGEIFTYIRLK